MTHEWQPSNSVNKLLMWTSDSSFLYTWFFLINKPTCPINQCQIFSSLSTSPSPTHPLPNPSVCSFLIPPQATPSSSLHLFSHEPPENHSPLNRPNLPRQGLKLSAIGEDGVGIFNCPQLIQEICQLIG